MKKLLCLFLCVLALLSFAGCADQEEFDSMQKFNSQVELDYAQEYEYIDKEYEGTLSKNENKIVNAGYKDAFNLMMKTFSNSFTKEELKAMYPDACWTWFKEEKGKTLDDIYDNFSSLMATNWEKTKETVGQDAEIKYEFENLVECDAADYEELKTEITEKYGVDQASYGRCYNVRIKRATVGSLKENIYSQWYQVLQINEKWYVAEVLLVMPVI